MGWGLNDTRVFLWALFSVVLSFAGCSPSPTITAAPEELSTSDYVWGDPLPVVHLQAGGQAIAVSDVRWPQALEGDHGPAQGGWQLRPTAAESPGTPELSDQIVVTAAVVPAMSGAGHLGGLGVDELQLTIPVRIELACDVDGDGHVAEACGGLDCADDRADVGPGLAELCDGIDNDCDPGTEHPAGEWDGDTDGSPACADCDDWNPAVAPDLAELCDGLDNDCDGSPDADQLGEVDGDGDGYLSCVDCDDGAVATHPGAAELCNGLDDDCDGAGDGDADADGAWTCLDCDDSDASVLPGADEVCDAKDNDCNGAIDEGMWSVPSVLPTVQAAIDAADQGDTVCLAPGVHVGAGSIVEKSLNLVGAGGSAGTTLDIAGARGPVVVVSSTQGAQVSLRGLTITGVQCEAEVCHGAVWLTGGDIEVVDLRVVQNEGSAAALLVAADSLVVERLWIEENGGRALDVNGGSVSISGLWVAENHSQDSDAVAGLGTVRLAGCSSVSLNNAFVRGTASTGGGLVISDTESFNVGQLWAVSTTPAEVGLRVSNASGVVDGLVAVSSSSLGPTSVPAILVEANSDVVIRHAAVGGYLGLGVGGIEVIGSSADIWTSVFFDNEGSVASIGSLNGGGLFFSRSAFSNNASPAFEGIPDPTSWNLNTEASPGYATDAGVWGPWSLQLEGASGLVGMGEGTNPDGSTEDIGPFGGPSAAGWDLDGDGAPAAWRPGAYTPLDRAEGFDCNDFDPTVGPENGC